MGTHHVKHPFGEPVAGPAATDVSALEARFAAPSDCRPPARQSHPLSGARSAARPTKNPPNRPIRPVTPSGWLGDC